MGRMESALDHVSAIFVSVKVAKFEIKIHFFPLRLVCHFFVRTTFDVICDLLLNRRTATWNPVVKLTLSLDFRLKTGAACFQAKI